MGTFRFLRRPVGKWTYYPALDDASFDKWIPSDYCLRCLQTVGVKYP